MSPFTTLAGAGGTGDVVFGDPDGQIEIGAPEAEGTSPDVPRADHVHANPAAPAGDGATTSLPGDAEADGTATTAARSDHVHGREPAAALAALDIAIGTVYQNTAGAALAVTASLALAPSSTGALSVALGIGTTDTPAGVVVAEVAAAGPAVTVPLSFVVPPGNYYELTATLNGGTVTVAQVTGATL